MSEFLGIAREPVYSPGKVEADRAILDAVASRLAARHRVRVATAVDGLSPVSRGTVVFTMCQGGRSLDALRGWEAAGVRVVNSVAAIENCHRVRMLPAFRRSPVHCPRSVLVSTGDDFALPDWAGGEMWVKRGDVHATEPGDVVKVGDVAALRVQLARLAGRGIVSALVQRHVAGEVIKFYAVRDSFFEYFSEPPRSLGYAEVSAMRSLAAAGARALGLEIFGGDCVRAADGEFWLIDLNDWPSYGPCRLRAAEAIGAYLDAQVRNG